ncbi:MAG: hypothetical protein EPO21_04690 [Chloroflexota bacterium]|nr:MAG: hypothetical protein EPO21_04690 [Chloroflexota bacterium]
MIIGRIVKSNSHVDYVCHVFGAGEMPETPTPRDYALGRFVRVPVRGEEQCIVGVIYDTLLLNPDFGNLGPRLSPESELEVFSPDYLTEKAVLVGIVALGMISWGLGEPTPYPQPSTPSHAMPILAPVVGAEVHVMAEQEMAAFHLEQGALRVGYLPRLASAQNPVLTEVLVRILADLERHFPEQSRRLALLRSNLSWKSRVEGLR